MAEKYRAWHDLENRWVTHDELLNQIEVSATVVEPSVLEIGHEHWTFEKYIGVKDKLKNMLFAGDIVEAWNEGYKGIFVIKLRLEAHPMWILYPAWQNREFWSIAASKVDNDFIDDGLLKIGNRHENPELITSNQ